MSTLEKPGAEIEEDAYSNWLNVDRLIADGVARSSSIDLNEAPDIAARRPDSRDGL